MEREAVNLTDEEKNQRAGRIYHSGAFGGGIDSDDAGSVSHRGIESGAESYREVTAVSETQLLLSTLTNALSDELRYARDIVTKTETADSLGNVDRFLSVSYGRNTRLSLQDGQLYANNKRVLAAGAYGNGAYSITNLRIVYDEADGVFQVDVAVGGPDHIAAETSLAIRPLNSMGGGTTN